MRKTVMSLEEVKNKLPNFVRILDETYVDIKTPATFIDVEYDNEEFIKPPLSVMKYQMGCKTRHIANVRANSFKQHNKRKEEEQKDPRYSIDNLLKLTEQYSSRFSNFIS